MRSELDLEIQYSVDDYVRGLTFIQNRQFILKYGFIVIPSLLLIFFLGLFLLYPASFRQMSVNSALVTFAPILVISLIFLLLKFFPNPLLKWNIQKQFRSSPILQEKQLISIDDAGIQGKTNLSSGETRWPAIIEAFETKDDFFFFTSNKFAMFIPKNNLTVGQQNEIRELAKRNLGEKAKF